MEGLLEAARYYLKEAGISLPCATLELRDDEVVLHGAPHSSEILVCALNERRVESYL